MVDLRVVDAETICLQLLGVRIDIAAVGSGAAGTAERIRTAWRHCLVDPSRPAPAVVRLTVDPQAKPSVGESGILAPDTATALELLSQVVTVQAIDARAGQLLMLHAAAVAAPDTGATLAVVGSSGMGKSTWLLTHGPGRRYLSDETVAVHGDLRVESLAKPVSVLTGGAKDQLDPSDLHMGKANGSEHLAGIWLLDRQEQHVVAHLEPIDVLDALPLLAEHASHLPVTPRPLHLMASVLDGCRGLQIAHYREASDLTAFVDEALARAS